MGHKLQEKIQHPSCRRLTGGQSVAQPALPAGERKTVSGRRERKREHSLFISMTLKGNRDRPVSMASTPVGLPSVSHAEE